MTAACTARWAAGWSDRPRAACARLAAAFRVHDLVSMGGATHAIVPALTLKSACAKPSCKIEVFHNDKRRPASATRVTSKMRRGNAGACGSAPGRQNAVQLVPNIKKSNPSTCTLESGTALPSACAKPAADMRLGALAFITPRQPTATAGLWLSQVEHRTLNPAVGGSNPSRPALDFHSARHIRIRPRPP